MVCATRLRARAGGTCDLCVLMRPSRSCSDPVAVETAELGDGVAPGSAVRPLLHRRGRIQPVLVVSATRVLDVTNDIEVSRTAVLGCRVRAGFERSHHGRIGVVVQRDGRIGGCGSAEYRQERNISNDCWKRRIHDDSPLDFDFVVGISRCVTELVRAAADLSFAARDRWLNRADVALTGRT